MLKTIRQTIKQYNMLTPGDGIVVGLSGGADSVVLLSILMGLREEWNLSVYAAHINHNLRGDAACLDERFVRLLCEDWGVPLFVFQADVKGFAESQRLNIEESGRKLRYEYLNQALSKFGAQKIATGHHADDNAETVLLNLFRGAGLKGLCGIPTINGPVIRPLLEVSRKSIEAYARKNSLNFIIDETNTESDYSRNYIRNKVIPVIQEHFGDVAETMARNALWMRADDDFLSSVTDNAVNNLSSVFTPTEIIIPIDELLAQPLALARRIIRQAIITLRGKKALEDIQAMHIQAILDVAQGRSGRQADLPGFAARREYANLVLHTLRVTQSEGFCISLSPDTPTNVQQISVNLSLQPPKNPFYCTQAFNYDKLNNVLEIRTRRPGDKINLAGVGTKKLQDYFTDTKMPKAQRDTVPLLADGSNVLWIMDKHNRTSAAYKPVDRQQTCWVTVETVF